MKLANTLLMLHAGASVVKRQKKDDEFDEERAFYAKFQQSLLHKKNKKMPICELVCDDNNAMELFEQGIPCILVNLYDRKSHEIKAIKDLIDKEKMIKLFTKGTT